MTCSSIRFAAQTYILLLLTLSSCEYAVSDTPPVVETPRRAGEWIHIIDPNRVRDEHSGDWYCNDHTLVQDSNGRWHAYGIIGHRPANPWDGEKHLFHASSDQLLEEGWEDHGYALSAKAGKEAVLWAPHVVRIDDTLWMFYNAGNTQDHARNYASWGTLHVARSSASDGYRWERDPLNPLFSDAGHARDSFVCRIDGKWHWYYTSTVSESELLSAVKLRTSPDLAHWSGAVVTHTQAEGGYWGGNAESPQVIERNGVYYLFVTLAMEGYDKTHVYWSVDPLNFPRDQFVTEVEAHAPELIETAGGEWFITTCGWEKHGVYIAPLTWE